MFYTIPTERPDTPLLDTVIVPSDLRRLSLAELDQLVDELRHFLLYTVGQTGGHFGAGLGVIELRPELILVGKPLNMDGTDSDIMKTVNIFFEKLNKITNIPCEYVDERLTSFEARQNLLEIKTDLVDAHAAKILIDHWLSEN